MPRSLERLLRLLLDDDEAAAVAGDLTEEYHRVRRRRAGLTARGWFAREVASVLAYAAVDRVRGYLGAPSVRPVGGVGMGTDIVFALRLFRRQPGPFLLTITGLAVAIGLSAAVFSVAKTMTFSSLGIADVDAVFHVALTNAAPSPTTGDSGFSGSWAFSDYVRVAPRTSSMALTASAGMGADVSAARDGQALHARVHAVSGNFFQVLGLKMALGRALSPADDVPGSSAVVLNEAVWKSRFAADRSILGRTVWLSGRPFTVAGVADRTVSSPPREGVAPAAWITLSSYRDAYVAKAADRRDAIRRALAARRAGAPLSDDERRRFEALDAELESPVRAWNPNVEVRGRLNPGVPPDRAEAELRGLASVLAGGGSARPTVALESVSSENREAGRFAVLMSLVMLVVLLACANVTNLLLAQATARRREIGTRLAIGATRARIVRQLLTESVLAGALAGFAGIAVSRALIPVLATVMNVPEMFDVSPDGSVYAFALALGTLTGLVAGLAPARFGRRGHLLSALAGDKRLAAGSSGRTRVRALLVGAQAAGSVVFLVLAALLARSLFQSVRQDLGFDPDHLMIVTYSTGWDEPGAESVWREAREALRSVPDIVEVALTTLPPFGNISVGSMPNGQWVNRNDTSPEYFPLMGQRVLEGRTYTDADMHAGVPVAVISASLARQHWGRESPIGARLDRVWGTSTGSRMDRVSILRRPPDTRVIGVVSDITTEVEKPDTPTIYMPLIAQSIPRLLVRTHGDPHRIERRISDVLQHVDPSVEPYFSYSEDGLARQMRTPRTLATLAGLAAATALALALIGLFGVTAFVVRHRTHEISVRRALGASEGDVVRMVLRESLRPVGIGLAAGVGIALIGGRVVQGLLYGVSARDPLAIGAAGAVLLGAAMLAAFVPARRAAGINPAELLKLQ